MNEKDLNLFNKIVGMSFDQLLEYCSNMVECTINLNYKALCSMCRDEAIVKTVIFCVIDRQGMSPVLSYYEKVLNSYSADEYDAKTVFEKMYGYNEYLRSNPPKRKTDDKEEKFWLSYVKVEDGRDHYVLLGVLRSRTTFEYFVAHTYNGRSIVTKSHRCYELFNVDYYDSLEQAQDYFNNYKNNQLIKGLDI